MAIARNSDLVGRMRRAAMLDVGLYEEVEHDLAATNQALLVVVIVAIAAGIGLGIGSGWGGGLLTGIVGAIVGWIVWSLVTYVIGTQVFGGSATPGELLRTIGFAQSPRVFDILAFIPILGGLIRLAVFIWLLATGIVAIRQALDVSTGRAVATAVIGWLAMLVIDLVLAIVTHTVAGLGSLF